MSGIAKAPGQAPVKALSNRTSGMRFMNKMGGPAAGPASGGVSRRGTAPSIPANTSGSAASSSAAGSSAASGASAAPFKLPTAAAGRLAGGKPLPKRFRYAVDHSSTVFDADGSGLKTHSEATGAMVGGRRSFAEFNRGLEAQAAGGSALAVDDNISAEKMAADLGFKRREDKRDERRQQRAGGDFGGARTGSAGAGGSAADSAAAAERAKQAATAYADHPALNPGREVGRYAGEAALASAAAAARRADKKGVAVPVGVKRARPYSAGDGEASDGDAGSEVDEEAVARAGASDEDGVSDEDGRDTGRGDGAAGRHRGGGGGGGGRGDGSARREGSRGPGGRQSGSGGGGGGRGPSSGPGMRFSFSGAGGRGGLGRR